MFFIRFMPYRTVLAAGSLLGRVAYTAAYRYRRDTIVNLELAFPGKDDKDIRSIALEVFRNLGMNVLEFVLLKFRKIEFWEKRIEVSGIENLSDNFSAGKGVVFLTAHIGNWELLASFLSMKGFPITFIARAARDNVMNDILGSIRSAGNMKMLDRNSPGCARKMLELLAEGKGIGILIDQDTKVNGVFVDFFGRPAYTPTSAAQFARIKNTVVVPAFIARKRGGKHHIEIMKSMEMTGDITKDTQVQTTLIENMIKKEPGQWVWMHKRWRTAS